jgi:hypothetical protein
MWINVGIVDHCWDSGERSPNTYDYLDRGHIRTLESKIAHCDQSHKDQIWPRVGSTYWFWAAAVYISALVKPVKLDPFVGYIKMRIILTIVTAAHKAY